MKHSREVQVKAFLKVFCSGLILGNFACMAVAAACEGDPCQDLLIRFSDRASPQQISSVLSQEGLEEVQFFPGSKIFRVEGNSAESSAKILKRLNAERSVAYAEPNYRVEATRSPNDPLYESQWALHNTGQSGGSSGDDINMEAVWNILTGSHSIVVAVIDTGIDYTHPDLAANMWTNPGEIPDNNTDDDHNGFVDDYYGYNFDGYTSDPMDDHFHGTHVAGTIGALGDNGIGVAGISWTAKLMAVKFLNSGGSGYLSDAISAIEYAVDNGATVLNNSWGFMSGQAIPSNPALEPVQSLRDAIAYADTHGAIFVAAAGNSGVDSDVYANYPSSYSVANILSVASTDRNDDRSSFSNWGLISVDLGAPGSSILSTYPTWYVDPPYATISGTSMATPHVAGAAAIIWADNPSLSHRQVIDRIKQGVTPLSSLAGITVTGGRLNVWQSILLNDPSLNHAPIAYAGADQYKEVGDTISLSGSATDEDGDTSFSYAWTLSKPSGSAASLSSDSAASTSFVADAVGDYYASLVASDWTASSTASTVTIHVSESASNRPTVVIRAQSEESSGSGEATIGSQVSLGEKIILNGTQSASGSAAADLSVNADESLSYSWSFIERPSGSQSSIYDSSQAVAYFYPDVSGRYTVQLSVSNGRYTSTGEVSFQAVSGGGSGGSADSGGGSGGCSMQAGESTPNLMLIPLLVFSLAFPLSLQRKRKITPSHIVN